MIEPAKDALQVARNTSEQYEDKGSNYAAEGTDAHTLGEYKLKTALGISAKDPTSHLAYYSEEMEECATGYAAYIMELVETAKQNCTDPVVLIGQRLDFSKYVEGGFGTGDCVVIADGTLHICDYEHGQEVLVESEENPQMKLYALGALELFDGIYDIDTVSMTVYQPRRSNISTHTVFKESLYQWAEEVLKPTAELAYDGEGEFRCGDWCQFCKAKHDCRKRAEQNSNLQNMNSSYHSTIAGRDLLERMKKLERVLKGYEQWEAALIKDDEAWDNELPCFTQELYDQWMELQKQRNEALDGGQDDSMRDPHKPMAHGGGNFREFVDGLKNRSPWDLDPLAAAPGGDSDGEPKDLHTEYADDEYEQITAALEASKKKGLQI